MATVKFRALASAPGVVEKATDLVNLYAGLDWQLIRNALELGTEGINPSEVTVNGAVRLDASGAAVNLTECRPDVAGTRRCGTATYPWLEVHATSFVGSGASMTGVLRLTGGTMTGAIVLASDPTAALNPASKQYVDRLVPRKVRIATTTTLPANTRSGNVLTADANGAFAAVDGVTLALNERILVKNEATGTNNGVFYLSDAGSGGTPWTLTRAADSDSDAEMTASTWVLVAEGTANADTGWLLTTNDAITLNTTALTFTQFPTPTSVVFSDSAFRVQDNGDATKQIAFEASGITTGTTRTFTAPNASGTLALIDLAQTFSAVQTFSEHIELGATKFLRWGSTSSFPAFKRTSTTIDFRLADDSAFCPWRAASGTLENGYSGGLLIRPKTAGTPGLHLSEKFAIDDTLHFIWAALGGSPDVGLGRDAAGMAAITTGTAGVYRDLKLRALYDSGGAKVIGTRGAAVADVASADATDLATVITLANEMKAQFNTWLARARAATGHGLIA